MTLTHHCRPRPAPYHSPWATAADVGSGRPRGAPATGEGWRQPARFSPRLVRRGQRGLRPGRGRGRDEGGRNGRARRAQRRRRRVADPARSWAGSDARATSSTAPQGAMTIASRTRAAISSSPTRSCGGRALPTAEGPPAGGPGRHGDGRGRGVGMVILLAGEQGYAGRLPSGPRPALRPGRRRDR